MYAIEMPRSPDDNRAVGLLGVDADGDIVYRVAPYVVGLTMIHYEFVRAGRDEALVGNVPPIIVASAGYDPRGEG